MFNDFATEEFLNKNVRVRPVSGLTHGDDTRDGRQSTISRGAIGEQSQDDGDETFNRNAILDLQEQRAKVIERQFKLEEELRAKKAKDEKLKE